MKKLLLSLTICVSGMAFSQIWQNDFSNPADWISTDLNAGTDAWIISSSGIGGDVDSISSASATNGFAQFNSEGQCASTHQDVTLTYYQPIDLTTNQLSYLEFVQHYKRGKDTVFVEFSNDGLTWQSVRVNKEMWYYQQSDDPDTVQVSIPSNIQTQPFWLRFRFQGYCGFAWLLDDLMIFEKEQFGINASDELKVNNLNYAEMAYCFSDTINGEIFLENFGYDTIYNLVIRTDVYRNDVFDFTKYDTIAQINPEISFLYTQTNLLIDPFYQEQLNFYFSVYSSDVDTVNLLDSINISYHSVKRFSGELQGSFMTDNNIWGIGNVFYCTEILCPIETKVYVPNDPAAINQIIWLLFFKKVNGILQYYTSSYDYVTTSADTGNWVNLGWANSSGYPYYDIGDTGVVVYTTYGNVFPIPYGEAERNGFSYLFDGTSLILDIDGHSALIKLEPYGGYDCSTCWESLDENSKLHLEIYPNPASVEIQIQNLTQAINTIRISTIDGREVYRQDKVTDNMIPISFLETGTYMIFVETEDGTIYSEKFVKI